MAITEPYFTLHLHPEEFFGPYANFLKYSLGICAVGSNVSTQTLHIPLPYVQR